MRGPEDGESAVDSVDAACLDASGWVASGPASPFEGSADD